MYPQCWQKKLVLLFFNAYFPLMWMAYQIIFFRKMPTGIKP